jgi:hypothetical protein
MKLRKYFVLYLLFFVFGNTSADIIAELTKRDRRNVISFDGASFTLFSENGYLITKVWSDERDETSIVAYQIHDDAIKLIIRHETRDFVYRIFDMYDTKSSVDQFTVDVHNYYMVELVYINNKLEIYCNRIMDINTNGFIFNTAEIGRKANNLPYEGYLTYSDGFTLTEGMKTEILSFTNERANQNGRNTGEIAVYDYRYYVAINGRKLFVNGYFVDFSNRIKLF